MRFIVARNTDTKIVGFCSFQFDLEEIYPVESSGSEQYPDSLSSQDKESQFREVVYCYEIQVSRDASNQGIGTALMNCLEAIARHWMVPSIMLTVFKVNKGALRFYFRLGFTVDPSSPSQTLSRLEALEYDYEVLEKVLV
ncbi:hypothetical protein DSO57_1028262 [Entomophthora muscae]|uniref:Uncharacterized protein n=1 Tax=Entomophthora muscae TaxID=34485 RepID=A0ACC2ULL5_9FUNG|nr:hypothetical protein DSO57_1028262 [Entomophthora muscae]